MVKVLRSGGIRWPCFWWELHDYEEYLTPSEKPPRLPAAYPAGDEDACSISREDPDF